MRFISLKSINGEPVLVNVEAVRTVASVDLAGTEMGIISFDKSHELVVSSTVEEVMAALAAAPLPLG
ncbi:hypothetical protein ACG3SL_06145 [Sphingomonas sp. CJ20]